MISIDLADDGGFILGVPSPEVIHHIKIPASEAGVGMIKKLLMARAKGQGGKISQPANPTQWQVDQWLKADRETNRIERELLRKQREDSLALSRAELFEGIDLGELDL